MTNIGIDYFHPVLVPYYAGYNTLITNTGGIGVFYRAATNGNSLIIFNGTDSLLPAGGVVTIGQNMYLIGQAAGAQVDVTVTPIPAPLFVGTTLVTSTSAQQILEKLLINSNVTNEMLAEGLNIKIANLEVPSQQSNL